MSEQHLTAAIIAAINATRMAFVWRSQAGTLPVRGRYVHMAPNGCPDIIGYIKRGPHAGRFVGIEVKLPGEEPSAAQTSWRQDMLAAGCLHAVAHTVAEAFEAVCPEPT